MPVAGRIGAAADAPKGENGPVRRLTLFAKGNVDLHDSLHSCRIGGALLWNGLNEALRQHGSAITARIRHETWTRSDALLASDGTVPSALAGRSLDLGAYPIESQFSRAVFETPSDAVVLSLQPDIATGLLRHKEEGFLFYANNADRWPPRDRQWLRTDFAMAGPLDVDASMANLEAVIATIRSTNDAPILVYNLSPVIPGEMVHCYQGLDETLSTRIRRFNLGLAGVSERTGISIVDIDMLVARHGADTMKHDAIHLTPQAYRLAAGEVIRVLDDLGVLDTGNR